jgi:DNA invertase Pin-like site-specific DNA recombinase
VSRGRGRPSQRAGAIFGLEVSRLARSSADLSRLSELARLTDTLVVDSDGIYDLASFNDSLLLGLRGTMSEAELRRLCVRGRRRAQGTTVPEWSGRSSCETLRTSARRAWWGVGAA